MNIRVETFKTLESIPLSRNDWNQLVSVNKTNTIFQTYEWIQSWLSNYGYKHQLIILVAYKEDQLVGIAPLMTTKTRSGQHMLHFIGDLNSDYCDFIISGNRFTVISAFLDYIYSGCISWSQLTLSNIPNSSTSVACVHTYCKNKNIHMNIFPPTPTPALIVKDNHDFAIKLANKYSVTRHLKKLSKLGDVSFSTYTNASEISEYLDDFFNQHVERYRLKHQISQFMVEENRQFYRKIVDTLGETDWLRFSVLFIDKAPVAYHLGFEYNSQLVWYKPSFDPKYQQYSPGTILLKHLIEYCVHESLNELDFTIGDEIFKSRFSNRTTHNNSIAIYRSRLIFAACAVRQYIWNVMNHFKKNKQKRHK